MNNICINLLVKRGAIRQVIFRIKLSHRMGSIWQGRVVSQVASVSNVYTLLNEEFQTESIAIA